MLDYRCISVDKNQPDGASIDRGLILALMLLDSLEAKKIGAVIQSSIVEPKQSLALPVSQARLTDPSLRLCRGSIQSDRCRHASLRYREMKLMLSESEGNIRSRQWH